MAAEADTPLYRDLAAELRQAIVSGDLAPGAVLPTEAELASKHGVSRNTVRLALGALTAEGLITTGRGRGGRRVQHRQVFEFSGSKSESMERADERRPRGVDAFVADAHEQGLEPDQKIAVEIDEAPPDMANRLEVAVGSPAVVRRRVRYINGEPHDLNDTWYPADVAEGTPIMYPADVRQGVIALMREMGHVQVRYRDEVEARMPTPMEIQRLAIPPGWPVIVQTRTGYTSQRPIKVTVTVWPADRARLIYELDA